MPQKSFNKQHFFFAVFLLFFSFALATPTLPQQQVVVKLILLITQVAPLTLEGNLNSNMAISKGVSKHHGNQEHGSAWDHEKSFGGHKDDNVDRSADFHTYAVEWDESNLNFYFDDKKFASYNRPTEIKQLEKQYIIINLAIGGWAGNDIEVTAESPAYYEADWVRVWQAKIPKTFP